MDRVNKGAKKWVIKNKVNGLYWSNFTGWGSKSGATKFSDAEWICLNLPIDGQWIRVHR